MRTPLLLLVLVTASTALSAQQPPRETQPPAPIVEAAPEPQPAEAAPGQPDTQPPAAVPSQTAAPEQPAEMQEINVDRNCRIVVEDRPSATRAYSHPRLRADPAVCHLISIHHTRHYEENLDNGVLRRTLVEVSERTFVLNNVSSDPVAFIVHQPVFHDGHIDSDPAPIEIADGVASFRVIAGPGQTVQLHVGERR